MPTTEALSCVTQPHLGVSLSVGVEAKPEQDNPQDLLLQPLDEQQEDHPLPELHVEMPDEDPRPVNRIAAREEKELFQHRVRGHADVDPRCQHCATARVACRRSTDGSNRLSS